MTSSYDNIFTDDRLDIKSNVIDFAHLIGHEDFNAPPSSKVYSVSAEFGVGKTFFCTKLYEILQIATLNTFQTSVLLAGLLLRL